MTPNNPTPPGPNPPGTPPANINILSQIGSCSNQNSQREEISIKDLDSEKIYQALTTLGSLIDSLVTVYSDLLTITQIKSENGATAPTPRVAKPADPLDSWRRLKAAEIDQVWQQWLLALQADRKAQGKPKGVMPRLDLKRQNLVASRLRDGHAAEDLCKAVRGIWRSAWHRDNDQLRFELALRDAGQIERFVELDKPLAAPPAVAKPPMRYKPTAADRALYGAPESTVASSPPAATRPER